MSQNNAPTIRIKANSRKKSHPFLRALFKKLFFPWKHIVIYAPGDFQNPYQALLYSSFKAYVTPVKIDKVLRYQKYFIAKTLHIHWDEAVIPKSDPKKAEYAKQVIKHFHQNGGKIIWTVHNKMPHEIRTEQEKADFLANREFMCKYADKIHVHNQFAYDYLISTFNVDYKKVVVIPHPSYLEWYSVTSQPQHFTEKKHLLLFGNIRGYKGFDLVADAFTRITQRDALSELHIAGNGADQVSVNKELASLIPLRFTSGYISDDEVEELFRVADYAVFGFKAILTSGSVMLAISFGVPPIAPAHPAVIDSLPEELHDLLYTPNDPIDFARVIDYALSLGAKDYTKKVSVCNEFAENTKPSKISHELEKQMFG